MPQLDINLMHNFVYWLCLSFAVNFSVVYILFFFRYVNKKKLIYFYKLFVYLKVQYLIAYIKVLNAFKY